MNLLGRIPGQGLLLFATVLLLCVGCNGDSLDFVLTFDDAKGLQPGQYVVYKGIRVGKVTKVSFDPGGEVRVDVTVDPEHRNTVYREARFTIAKPGGVTDVSGEMQITVKDRSGSRTPIENGAVIKGSNGFWGGVGGVMEGAWRGAQDALASIKETIEKARSSPDGQEFERSVREFTAKARGLGEEELEKLRSKELPRLKEKAGQLREKLRSEEGEKEAKEFWNHFKEWLDQVGAEADEEEK